MSALLRSTVVSIAENAGSKHIVLICSEGVAGGEVWLQLHVRPAHFITGESDNRSLGEAISESGRCSGSDGLGQQVTFASWLQVEVRERLSPLERSNFSSVTIAVHRTLEAIRRAQCI